MSFSLIAFYTMWQVCAAFACWESEVLAFSTLFSTLIRYDIFPHGTCLHPSVCTFYFCDCILHFRLYFCSKQPYCHEKKRIVTRLRGADASVCLCAKTQNVFLFVGVVPRLCCHSCTFILLYQRFTVTSGLLYFKPSLFFVVHDRVYGGISP